MSRVYIQKILLTFICEISGVSFAFFIAYSLRLMRDWIPFIQLPIPYISYEQFVPFVLSGVIFWCAIFAYGGLYSLRHHIPIIEEIRRVITYSFLWFFIYIAFVYLSTGFIFVREIPRLIILYAYLISTMASIVIRYTIYLIYHILYKNKKIQKELILIIANEVDRDEISENEFYSYIYRDPSETSRIESIVRRERLEYIIYLGEHQNMIKIFNLAKIYGIPLMYPQISRHITLSPTRENWMGEIPMIELRAVSITVWGRITKRIFDVIISASLLIILFPVYILVSLGVYLSDPSGPIIYRNRRIGQNGRIFAMYKFRYMYWKYCTKEEYGIEDGSMEYEEKLKKEKNTREGPLYKISNDPRKMWFGKVIERLSIDELPQLYNVLCGDMSLIGPRPHQPREIDLYSESDRQVLTIKPGITGMAQVYGRDKNTFREEIALDTYYIEHYSAPLDLAILFRTIFVVLQRIWR